MYQWKQEGTEWKIVVICKQKRGFNDGPFNTGHLIQGPSVVASSSSSSSSSSSGSSSSSSSSIKMVFSRVLNKQVCIVTIENGRLSVKEGDHPHKIKNPSQPLLLGNKLLFSVSESYDSHKFVAVEKDLHSSSMSPSLLGQVRWWWSYKSGDPLAQTYQLDMFPIEEKSLG